MTSTLPANPTPSFGVVSRLLPRADRWRCVVLHHGCGTVVSDHVLLGHVMSYRVELDSGEDLLTAPGFVHRLQPAGGRAA